MTRTQTVSKAELHEASLRGILNESQAAALWAALEARDETAPRFDAGNVLFYLGGLIVISSLSWFLVDAWERLGGLGIALTAVSYAVAFALTGRTLWAKPATRTPGGILFTAAVWMTPLAVYGIQRALGWWPGEDPGKYTRYYAWIHGSWVTLELATVAVGALVLRKIRFPFVTFPMAVAVWFLSMDLAGLVLEKNALYSDERNWISIAIGLVMLTASFLADRRTKQDYSFWGYLFGLAAFWGGLSLLDSSNEFGKFVYALINLGLIFLSVFLDRRAFIVFGAIGLFGYLGHLVETVFKDQVGFPFVLSALGIGVIAAGIHYRKHRARIEARMLAALPKFLLDLRPTISR